MEDAVTSTSLAASTVSADNCPVVRWVSTSKLRIDSSVSPKKSSLTGPPDPGG